MSALVGEFDFEFFFANQCSSRVSSERSHKILTTAYQRAYDAETNTAQSLRGVPVVLEMLRYSEK